MSKPSRARSTSRRTNTTAQPSRPSRPRAERHGVDLSIAPIIAKLLSAVDWEQQLQHDLSFAQRQIEYLRDATQQWAGITGQTHGTADDNAGLSDGIHELANRLRKVGDSMEHVPQENVSQGEAIAVRAAAQTLDDAADNLAVGIGNKPELTAALGHAADALTDARTLQATNNLPTENEDRETRLPQ